MVCLPKGFLLFALSFFPPFRLGAGLASPSLGRGAPCGLPVFAPLFRVLVKFTLGPPFTAALPENPKCLMPNVAQGTLERCAK